MAVNPAFVINFYQHDAWLAEQLLPQIRSLYPTAWIGAIADGYHPPFMPRLCEDLGVEYLKGDRLKIPQHGGLWVKRYLQFGRFRGDPLIKIDPDSWIFRRFDRFSDADVAGTLVCYLSQKIHIVRGGCVAYKQRAIARILESKLLDDRCYTNQQYYAYYRFSEWGKLGEGRSNELIAGEDCIMGHVAKRLRLVQKDWPEVRICFRESVPDNEGLMWAVTHPR